MTIKFNEGYDDNAAFRNSNGYLGIRGEVSRILRKVANDLEYGMQREGSLVDINGNVVGEWKL